MTRAPRQPEPCVFVAPVDLDGDPPRSQLTVRAVLLVAAFVAALGCALGLLAGCAPSLQGKRWSPASVTVLLDPKAPSCAEWAVEEAWLLLRPKLSLAIQRGGTLATGRISIVWDVPSDYPRTLAVTYPLGDHPSWQRSDSITRAIIAANECSPRLLGHELAHALGVPHAAHGLMHPVFPRGGWELTRRQRRALR